jgi:drug/metabolite transporter (DMT)-like permease
MDWVFLSAFAAITFGLGDFIVVLSGEKRMDVFTLYMTYMILVGILSFLILMMVKNDSLTQIKNFTKNEWIIVLCFSFLYFVAYLSHFNALQKAPNPGYSNVLIMFHVVVLTLLSYYFLNKPLNLMAVLGILITFIGVYMVVFNANVE